MEIVKNIVNIVNILHDMDYNNVYDYRNTIICIDEIGLNVYGNNFRTTVDINKSIGNLIDRIKDISDEIEFVAYEDMKDIKIGDVLENGKYWKENKMIDSCENKDKICKSRAECMREITEQNKFDVEEEFKKICIKERENVLERIHEEIEEKAKKGNNKVEVYLNVNYLGCDFGQLYYSSSMFYNDGTILRDDYSSFYGRRFFLSEFVNANSYVWKFVDKLDYQTAKRISLLHVRDWIKQTLVEDEGFDVEVSEYGVFTISW